MINLGRFKKLALMENLLRSVPVIALGLLVLLIPTTGYALDSDGNGNTTGLNLQALYRFNNTSGPVIDSSGVGTALNMTITDEDLVDSNGNSLSPVQRKSGSIVFNRGTLIQSIGSASKIVNACKTSGEMTIEAWVNNDQDGELRPAVARKIVTLSNSGANVNASLVQDYDGNSFYDATLKTGSNDSSSIRVPENIFKSASKQQIFVTRDKLGVGRIYVSDVNGVPILRSESVNLNGDFNDWDSNVFLGFGNETLDPNSGGNLANQAWLGEIFMVAIYCKALSVNEVLGDQRAPKPIFTPFKTDRNLVITPLRKKALTIYRRLVGVTTAMSNPVLTEMENLLAAGDAPGAARKATEECNFYNRTVSDFAKRMSTREETTQIPLNDFAAMVVGVTRDQTDARTLLTGDFTYMGDVASTAVPRDMIPDVLTSNNHYQSLESSKYCLKNVLVKVTGQQLFDGNNAVIANPEPAGLLTSRAFMGAHAVAGTNRRLVQFSFREFMCRPISLWADASGPDSFIGKDVTRFPGGDHSKFQKTCRSCHSMMDPLRPAFARFNFDEDQRYVQHAFRAPAMEQNPTYISAKYNRNETVYPGGYTVDSTFWTNYLTWGVNGEYFGWGNTNSSTGTISTIKGFGLNQFGKMMSESKSFPSCMAERVFRSVCKRDSANFDKPMLDREAQYFSANGFNLRELFGRIAITPECVGN